MSSSDPTSVPDVYTNTEEENYPGLKLRSRPGTAPHEAIYDKVRDPSGRLVSAKPANRAFLASQSRRQSHALALEADRARRASSPTSSTSYLRPILLLLLFLPLLSQFLTSSFTFNLSPYVLPRARKLWEGSSLNPRKSEMREFTSVQLGRYDGSDPFGPVYLGIDGVVYDVSKNRRVYGKGGSYNMMAGRDAARSFVTGCFETHLTHDLRGLSPTELKSLDHWKSFFADHAQYRKIGTIRNPPIDPHSPIPPPCRPESEEAEHAPGEAAAQRGRIRPEPVQAKVREEL